MYASREIGFEPFTKLAVSCGSIFADRFIGISPLCSFAAIFFRRGMANKGRLPSCKLSVRLEDRQQMRFPVSVPLCPYGGDL